MRVSDRLSAMVTIAICGVGLVAALSGRQGVYVGVSDEVPTGAAGIGRAG